MCACFLFVFVCLCLVFRFPICSSLFCFCWLHSLEQRMALFLRFNCLINLLYFRFLPSITQLTYTSQPRVHVREIFRRIEDRRERTVTKRVHTTNNRLPIDDFFGQPKSSLPQEFKGGGGGTTSQRLQQVISLRATFHTSLSLSCVATTSYKAHTTASQRYITDHEIHSLYMDRPRILVAGKIYMESGVTPNRPTDCWCDNRVGRRTTVDWRQTDSEAGHGGDRRPHWDRRNLDRERWYQQQPLGKMRWWQHWAGLGCCWCWKWNELWQQSYKTKISQVWW